MKKIHFYSFLILCLFWHSCKISVEYIHKVINVGNQPLIISYSTFGDSANIKSDTLAINQEFVVSRLSDGAGGLSADELAGIKVIQTIQTLDGRVAKKGWQHSSPDWETRSYETTGSETVFFLLFLRAEDF